MSTYTGLMHFPDYYVKYYVVQKRLKITITLLLEQEYHVKHLHTCKVSTLLHSVLELRRLLKQEAHLM